MLRQRGLALGGSLENAIVLGETGVLNPLRFEDEFVRHKILDVIGDLALVGHPIQGHLVVHRGGHALHTAFAAELLRQRDAWRFVEDTTPVDARGRAVQPASTSLITGLRLRLRLTAKARSELRSRSFGSCELAAAVSPPGPVKLGPSISAVTRSRSRGSLSAQSAASGRSRSD